MDGVVRGGDGKRHGQVPPHRVAVLVGGLGTTGSTRGAATYLRERNPALQTIGVVSSRSDFISGIRSAAEMWEVGLFQPDFYHAIVEVESSAAIDASLELATRYGVLAGPTSRATYAAATIVAWRDAGRPLDISIS